MSAQSLIPVANAMDGFATSHMMSEVLMPEPELLREFLGDPAGRIKAPTVAQDILFGAKGRVFQLQAWLARRRDDLLPTRSRRSASTSTRTATPSSRTTRACWCRRRSRGCPRNCAASGADSGVNAHERGTRQRVPALVDVDNPGLTGGVQNQPDFQAGSVDHRTHFVAEVPRFVREAMQEYAALTGRVYKPVQTFLCDDADCVVVGLGSVTDDAEAVATHLRSQGKKVGVVSVKLLQPFPGGGTGAGARGQESSHGARAFRRRRRSPASSRRRCSRASRMRATASVTRASRRCTHCRS